MIERDKKQVALDMLQRVAGCNTEDELESVSDMLEEALQIGYISEKEYRAIDEALEDRLMDLVEKGIV